MIGTFRIAVSRLSGVALAVLIASSALFACAQPQAPTTSQEQVRTSAPSTEQSKMIAADDLQKRLPSKFAVIGQHRSHDGGVCFVGSVLSEDGDARAWVYMMDRTKGGMRWDTAIALDPDFYQNRTTHCVCRDSQCRVLVATDTQSMQSLSQTLLSVATLSAKDGTIISVSPIDRIPGAPGNASAWVEPGDANFAWRGDSLEIEGKYRAPGSDETRNFQLTIKP
jgi:hypothetical protein